MRHTYGIDLLRSDITIELEIYLMQNKRELTPEDYDRIIENAARVKKAAITRKLQLVQEE